MRDSIPNKQESKMKIERCPRCEKNRYNDSPYNYVWWSVMGVGYMCWHCFKCLKAK